MQIWKLGLTCVMTLVDGQVAFEESGVLT